MDSQGLTTNIKGTVRIPISLLDREYELEFDVMDRLCADVILGQSFLCKHSEVSFVMEGSDAPLKIKQEHVLSVAAANVKPPRLFEFLSSDCKPIACRSRQYSNEELKYIDEEIERLLKADIIEPPRSPWRAQVLVVNRGDKMRLVINYSTTINRFTNLDAYPLPRIEALVNKIASDKHYSAIDLRSAYHQIPLKEKERIYTSFEACERLYQYKRLPFGVKNGVSAFQRVIDDFTKRHKLQNVHAYLDDVIVTGATEEEHDANLQRLLDAAKSDNLTLNKEKSKFKVMELNLLGYSISHQEVRPDQERLQVFGYETTKH